MASFTSFTINGSQNDRFVKAGSSLDLSWQFNLESNEELVYFNVVVKEPGYPDIKKSFNTDTTAGVAAHQTPGKYYEFQIEAFYIRDVNVQPTPPLFIPSNVIRISSYKAPGAPTNVKLTPSSVLPDRTTRVSWDAGTAGVGVDVSKYDVYRGSTRIGSTANLYLDIAAPTTAGTSSITVKAIGSVSGYDSQMSSAVVLTVVAPEKPVVSGVSLDHAYRAINANTTLRWTGTPKDGNAIIKYSVYVSKNGASYTHLGDTTGTTMSVAAPGVAGQRNRYYVLAVGEYSNSSAAYSSYLYAYKAPGYPESLLLSPAKVFPAKTSRLSWSASPAGVGVSVSKYEVYRGGTLLGSTTGLYMDITAPTTVGTSSITVKAIGSVAGYDSIFSPSLPQTVLDPVAIGSLDKSTVPMDGSSKIKLTVTPKSDTLFTHKAIWKTGNATVTQNLAAGVKEATLTVPLAWCAQYPNATSGTASVTLETYDGATKRGQKVYNFTVTVPASVVPTFTNLGATFDRNGVDSSITRYVQGYSKATLAINGAAGAQGSTITAHSITGAGKTVNAATGSFGPFSSSGDITFTGKITDSRGRTATKTTTITVQPYAKPSLSGAVAYRCLSNGTKNSSGTYALLKATSVFSSIDGQNTATLQGRVYMKGATPGAWQTMTSGSNLITGGGGLLVTKSYIAEIRITDKINNYILRFDIPTEIIGFHALDGATGAAVGKYAEATDELQIPEHWRARMNLQIKDIRGTNPAPEEMPDKALSTFFNDQYGDNWRSGITVRGWNTNYQTWQLAAPSSTLGDENLFFRVGRGASWGAWRTLLTDGNYNDYAPTLTGTGASGTWGISVTGNAASATKLATERTLTIGSTGKTFNGTGNVSWSLAEIGAAESSHNHTSLTGFTTISGGGATKTWGMGFSNDNYIFMQEGTATSTIRFYPDSGDVWFSGTLTSGTVPWARVSGAPTRYPASDVYAWAKAATKPSYTYSEVGAAKSSHSHPQNQVDVTISGYGVSTQAIVDYPSGLSVQYDGGTGTPSTVGQLITFNGGIFRNFQLWNTKDSENLYIRNYRSVDAVWAEWRLFLHSGNYNSYAADKNHVHGVETFSLTAASNASVSYSKCIAIGTLVVLNVYVWCGSSHTGGLLATVPSGYRPVGEVARGVVMSSAGAYAATVGTDGKIEAYPIPAGEKTIQMNFVYSRA